MTLLLAIACGLVIGMVLGALGGGGSILAVPALVYVLGQSAQDATTASLVVIGISAAIGAASYLRDGLVRWKVGLVFGVLGIAASFGGTALNRSVDENVLLGSFAGIMVVSAVAMIVTKRPSGAGATPEISPVVAASIVITALVVGFLTGFLGVGGGFVVVPALVIILRYPMHVATATSLLVIALNAAVSLSIHATRSPQFDWEVIVPFTAATIVASLLGKRFASRFSSDGLSAAFAGILLLVAAGITAQVVLF
ncbi:MAG: sulfite exporter TauE/SafE family protein [Aeromicrobium sp.]|uniref:sulfite exporter TauE/SafE family protein n=1 Tax=Aeromicrobium sp. TaxID=1871063 RepID=UPI003C381BC7